MTDLIDRAALREKARAQYDAWESDGSDFAAGSRSAINSLLLSLDATPTVECAACAVEDCETYEIYAFDHEGGCLDFGCSNFQRRQP